MRTRLASALAVLVLAAGCGGSGADPVDAPDYLAFRDQSTACGSEPPPPATEMSFDEPGDLGLTAPVEAVLHTSCGEVTLRLDPGTAPATVNSFVFLAGQGYFDGIAVHRVVPGYVVQIGDPTASGAGYPGYRLPDELPPAGFLYTRGTVAMANAGPDTGGSQFFIMLGDAALPPNYSVFGEVTGGWVALDRIAGVPLGFSRTGEPSRPLETVYVETVEVAGR